MITIEVDNKEIFLNNVWYHYKENLGIEKFVYRIEVDIHDNQIERLKKIHGTEDLGSDFISKLANARKSHFNTIQHLIDFYEEDNEGIIFSIDWVFNNITEVEQINDKIIIKGTASKAIP